MGKAQCIVRDKQGQFVLVQHIFFIQHVKYVELGQLLFLLAVVSLSARGSV